MKDGRYHFLHHPIARRTGWLLKVLLAIIVLFFLIHSTQIKFELFASILHKPFLFFCAILMFLLMVVLCAKRWHSLNSAQGINLSLIYTITPTYLGFAFNNVLPGAIGGDFVRLYYLFKKIPQQKSAALISLFLDRLFGFLGLVIAVCFVAISRLHQLNEEPQLFYLLFTFTVLCIGVLIAFITLMVLPQRIGIIEWLRQRFPHQRWSASLVTLLEAVRIYRAPKAVIIECLLISIIIQILVAITITIIASIMDFPSIAFSDYIIAIGITQIVNLIPMTPGGIGIGEMAFANILLFLNPGKSVAFATIFLAYRLISILTYLPGVICYVPRFVLLKQKSHLQENTI